MPAVNKLRKDQKVQYWEDGYLYPLDAVSQDQAASWREELEGIERDWLDNGLLLPLNTYKRVNAHMIMPLAHEIAAHPAILDLLEGVLGPDVMLYSTEFFH